MIKMPHQKIVMQNIDKNKKILVTGAGGFIGGHLVKYFIEKGYKSIRAIDIKPLNAWYQVFPTVENVQMDLKDYNACCKSVNGVTHVYNLAADMGGMGFIENNKTLCMLTVLINTHMLLASKNAGVKRFFFSSSACVYNADKQKYADLEALKEEDAYPAMPEDGYGWEKLFSERMCRHFYEDFNLETRVARFHNVYGPNGTYAGGREKAPAAICRKIIEAKLSGVHEIEIWGNGNQTRSFTYIEDCLKGIDMIMEHETLNQPLNLGSNELVSINQLVDIVEEIAQIKLKRKYQLDAPQGVNGRNSDNTLIQEILNWQPSIALKEGMQTTYEWIFEQMVHKKELVEA